MNESKQVTVTPLETIEARLDDLSITELLALQNLVTSRLEQKSTQDEELIKGSSPLASEELEADAIDFFGVARNRELTAFIKAGGLDNLPDLPKSLSEYIIEDREDRF